MERILFMIQKYGMSVLRGAETTMIIALVSTLIGCIIGLLVGAVQTIPVDRKKWSVKRVLVSVVKGILYVYVEVFRGTPMMVQAMFIYYGLLYMGVDMGWLLSAIIIVSINTGAYMAETTRGGILSIDPGQTEGAKAIGMTHWQTMKSVILPQALRNIMPQIGNNLIINIKDTCVLSVIGVVELFFASKSVAGTYYTYFETFTVTMVVYLILTVTVSRILRLVERKMDGSDSYDLASTDTLAHTSGMYRYPGKSGGAKNAGKEDRR
ncbi:MAG: amino acid ABC transporter permease [Oscillospiraceae bacterium]